MVNGVGVDVAPSMVGLGVITEVGGAVTVGTSVAVVSSVALGVPDVVGENVIVGAAVVAVIVGPIVFVGDPVVPGGKDGVMDLVGVGVETTGSGEGVAPGVGTGMMEATGGCVGVSVGCGIVNVGSYRPFVGYCCCWRPSYDVRRR